MFNFTFVQITLKKSSPIDNVYLTPIFGLIVNYVVSIIRRSRASQAVFRRK